MVISGPTGDTAISPASIAWQADRAIASARVVRPKTPADRPVRPDRISRLSQIRQAWSAGYWPIRKRRRLRVTTSQRASVSAHWATPMASTSSRPPSSPVMIELSRLENRFLRSQATGPMVVRGGASVSPVIGS